MATETRTFTLSIGPLYPGLSASCKIQLRTSDGTVRVDTYSGSTVNPSWVTVTEPIPGQYLYTVTNWDTTWVPGIALKYETSIPTSDSESFGATQTGDSFGRIGVAGAGLTAVTATATVTDKTGFSLAASGANLVLVNGRALPVALAETHAKAVGDLVATGTANVWDYQIDGVAVLTVAITSTGRTFAFPEE